MLSITDVFLGLQVAVAIMVIILLYHALFVVVDLRKILRRIEGMTSQLEDVLMKPLAVADQGLQWLVDFIEEHTKKTKKKGTSKAKVKGKGD